jgi:hypothetical protein
MSGSNMSHSGRRYFAAAILDFRRKDDEQQALSFSE